MGRPKGSENKDKPFRGALYLEIAATGGKHKELRKVARALLGKAADGDVSAIKEVADRLDGKVAQAVVGDSAHDPIRVRFVIEGGPD